MTVSERIAALTPVKVLRLQIASLVASEAARLASQWLSRVATEAADQGVTLPAVQAEAEPDVLISPKEAAGLAHCCLRTIRTAIKTGALEPWRENARNVQLSRAQVLAWANERNRVAPPLHHRCTTTPLQAPAKSV